MVLPWQLTEVVGKVATADILFKAGITKLPAVPVARDLLMNRDNFGGWRLDFGVLKWRLLGLQSKPAILQSRVYIRVDIALAHLVKSSIRS